MHIHRYVYRYIHAHTCTYRHGDLGDVVFVDDTLLIGVSDKYLTAYLHGVARAGKQYGMELHWGKFQILPINTVPKISTSDGTVLPTSDRMEYLGTVISSDVHDNHELNRRLGLARGDFRALSAVWKLAALCRKRRLEIYSSVVESRLLFGLSSVWLTTRQRRRLDGFQNRCVRSIIGVKPAFLSSFK